ncbi:helix-hairpin-helix domain-containing protein [Desulfosporosinus meridiei]|uniref:Competence protein ComEA-like protein with helix-hairpin-helix repeat region n=1 Tax=Desulfosporosinus meridiei (strain ATCC BAA-275 / DSM 13257 / KCTC 12902 / NCIMB 13706 / S10) TaxID=768704 RepID=J7J4K3_DESMD|nr:helix-hairpin-helix domain-containing protein [Desulfosporosinus meridiei]AFQ45861.1 competence protein ComEA-like protein with helix-hairpin-helix repeat region [Desulfosporosinus meridiei DSM 13257]
MERKLRYVWWFVLVALVIIAIWKLFLPHGTYAYVQKSDSSREIVVYVAGAVESPGLVHLAPDARLDDALKQVQLLPEANLENMNPAEKLKDGQKVTVPFKAVVAPLDPATGNSGGTGGVGSPSAAAPTATAAPATGTSVSVDGKININTAGAADLDKLSGIGPALAERIIQYRTENGLFARAEDLQNVSGIGPKTFEKMAAQVTVGP